MPRTPEQELDDALAAQAQEERAAKFTRITAPLAALSPEERAAQRGELTSSLDPSGLLPLAGAAAAGFLAPELAPLKGIGQLARFPSIVEGAGATAGELLRQAAREGSVDPSRALQVGGLTTLFGATGRGVSQLLGRLAGIGGDVMSELGGASYRFAPKGKEPVTVRPAPPGAYRQVMSPSKAGRYNLASEIKQEVGVFSRQITEGFEGTVKPYFESGAAQDIKIPVQDIQNALAQQIRPNTVGTAPRRANREITKILDEFTQLAEANGGKFSPKALYEFIDNTLDPSVYSSAGQPQHSLVARRLKSVRKVARRVLGQNIPAEVDITLRQIGPEIEGKRLAERQFVNKNPEQVVTTIRTLFGPGHEDTLMALNKVNPGLVARARRIARQESFSTGDLGVLGNIYRAAARIVAPLQRLTGPVTAAVTSAGLAPIQHASPEAELDSMLEPGQ